MNLVQKLFRQWSSRKYNLASYIKMEKGQFFFDLDEQALRKIHQARIRDCPLYVPCSLRIILLRHALLHIGVTTPNRRKKANTYLLPGLIFYTCYAGDQEDQKLKHTYFTPSTTKKKKLLRSLISPDGDILHQISSSSLQHPYFSEISATHHWLTTQLLNHLYVNLNWIPRLIWVIFTGGYIWLLWGQGTPSLSIREFVISLVPPLLLKMLWMWLQPLVIRWSLARILSSLGK